MTRRVLIAALLAGLIACKAEAPAPAPEAPAPPALIPATVALNWYPEPEFGGIYAAQVHGYFKDAGLDVTIRPGGPGSPVLPQVATGKVAFGVVSGDEVALGRASGAKVVCIFGTFQTHPQGVMVHRARGLTSLRDLKGGTLALESGPPFANWLRKTFPFEGVQIVPYDGSVARFLVDPDYAQQVYVTSEPHLAKMQGADPQVFLVADTGYNPYANVLITEEGALKAEPEVARRFVEAVSRGWYQYLKDPGQTNALISKLNPTMDADVLAFSAEAQMPLILSAQAKAMGIGSQDAARWETLLGQLQSMGLVQDPEPAAAHFTAEFVSPPAEPTP